METPRKTKLYNELAKDFNPKQADMLICKHMEGIEKNVYDLEKKIAKLTHEFYEFVVIVEDFIRKVQENKEPGKRGRKKAEATDTTEATENSETVEGL